MAARSVIFILLGCLVCLVTADYELSVTIYSYNNPENKCAACRDGVFEAFGCCDNHALKNAAECGIRTRPCEIVLSVCLRQPSNRYSDALCPNRNPLYMSSTLQKTTFSPPLTISSQGTTFDTLNSQLYITLNDDDFGSGVELVDSFPTNLTAGTRVSRGTLTGQFGLATIELELSLVCTGNFYGPDCSSLCQQPPCSCDPGFTGEFCETDIDECASVDCSGRGVCSDGVNSYTCACPYPYIGKDCQVSVVGVIVGFSLGGFFFCVAVVALIVTCFIRSKKKNQRRISFGKGLSINKSEKGDQLVMPILDKGDENVYVTNESAAL